MKPGSRSAHGWGGQGALLSGLLSLFLLGVCGPGGASEITVVPAAEVAVESLDRSHTRVSETLEGAAARVDAFFGQERAYEEATGTYVQWRTVETSP